MKDLIPITKKIRRAILTMNHRANASHSGSALSIVELLTVLYFRYLSVDPIKPSHPGRDRFILSKGHASSALYATLAYKGFFSEQYLDRF
jgi:transketolase